MSVYEIVNPKGLELVQPSEYVPISPTTEETLFGITASFHDTTIIRKFNYTALFIRHIFIQPSLIVSNIIIVNQVKVKVNSK